MDDKTKELLEDIREYLDIITDTTIKQHYTLVEHQRRSAANEARLDVMESFKDTFESHIDKMSGAITVVKWMGGVVTISLVLFQLIPYLKGL